MKIGVAGPATMEPLAPWLSPNTTVPNTYSFPYISQIVIAYLDAGHEVDLYTSSTEVSELVTIGSGPLRIFVGRRRESAKARGLDFFRLERSDIAEAIRRSAPDVVHAHWLYEFASAALSVRPDALITAHDSPYAIVKHYKHPYWWLRAALGLNTLRKTQNLSVVSPALSRETRLPRPASRKQWLIPNGIHADPHSKNMVKTLDLGQPVVFACVANGFDKRKNTAKAIAAFGQHRASYPGSTLTVFGKDHQVGGPAHQWAVGEGLDRGIEFKGETEHAALMAALHDKVHVLLHTSRWEACSIAVIECLSMGIPVIGGKSSGGMSYTLGDGAGGILVNIDSVREIADAMTAMVSSPATFGSFSQAASKLVKAQFDFETVIDTYLGILTAIADGSISESSANHKRRFQ